jgi:predicted nucleic acid-binding protein
VEFVDTNVLVYAHDASAGLKWHVAMDLLARLAGEQAGALSTQVLIEFYAAGTRVLKLPPEAAEAVLYRFGRWTIHRPHPEDLIRSARLHRQHSISWWDALILNSALELSCTTLWTEDFQDGQRFGALTVRNPFAGA